MLDSHVYRCQQPLHYATCFRQNLKGRNVALLRTQRLAGATQPIDWLQRRLYLPQNTRTKPAMSSPGSAVLASLNLLPLNSDQLPETASIMPNTDCGEPIDEVAAMTLKQQEVELRKEINKLLRSLPVSLSAYYYPSYT